jgi:hypothetical protein
MLTPLTAVPHLIAVEENRWTIVTVDREGNVGAEPKIVLDERGYPHIAYNDWEKRDLKYARWDGERWRIERVDWKDEVGRYTSIALDANDYPHISYWDATNDDLKYARWTGAEWEIGVVDSEGKVGSCASMALDSKGYPHISYWDDTAACLKYARWTGGDWRIEVIDNVRGERLEISLALDSDDRPHISYTADHPAEGYYELLKYARWTGAGWKVEVVDNEGIGCRWVHMALDSGDRPHIVYYFSPPRVNGPPGEWLKYARWTGAEWEFEVIDQVGWGGSPPGPAIALDSEGNPHIAYYGPTLMYAVRRVQGWRLEIVDNDGWAGAETSMVLDENDRPHIAYLRRYDRDLKYATLSEAIKPVEPQPISIIKIVALAIGVVAAVAALGILWRWRMG